jgi:hypothetical protein
MSVAITTLDTSKETFKSFVKAFERFASPPRAAARSASLRRQLHSK